MGQIVACVTWLIFVPSTWCRSDEASRRWRICSDACERFDPVFFGAPIVIWDYLGHNPCLQEMGFSTTQSADATLGVQVKVTPHVSAVREPVQNDGGSTPSCDVTPSGASPQRCHATFSRVLFVHFFSLRSASMAQRRPLVPPSCSQREKRLKSCHAAGGGRGRGRQAASCLTRTKVLTKRERRKAGDDMDTASCKR